MNSYSAFDTFLGKREHRNVPSIRATDVYRATDCNRDAAGEPFIGIRYQNTTVVRAHQDGTFTLNTGGWRTSTTKARINDFSPARVYQKKGVWYLRYALAEGDSGTSVRFYDGIRVDTHGVPVEVTK